MRYLFFSLPALIIWGCSGNDVTDFSKLSVDFQKVIIYEAPGPQARPLFELGAGSTVQDLGQVSRYETGIRFGDSLYQSPWIKVDAGQGRQGWAFAAALRPPALAREWMEQKRMICYFGKPLALRHARWKEQADSLRTAMAVARWYAEALLLRDTFVHQLQHRTDVSGADFHPDFYWLKHQMPGFVFQYLGPGSAPCLFVDFAFWAQIAARTPESDDDDFFQFANLLFPQDAIETYSPAYTFPLSDQHNASMLGSGNHMRLLQELCKRFSPENIFAKQYNYLKDNMIEDICGRDRAYWLPAETVVTELNTLVQHPPGCLGTADILSLEGRLRLFEYPEQNGIKTNLRAGE